MTAVDFVKLGGSLITDKRTPETLRREVLDRVAAEIASTLSRRSSALVVGHGSGSFGHVAATIHGLRAGTGGARVSAADASAVQDASHRLHSEVLAALRSHGVPALSFAPSSFVTADDGTPSVVFAEPLIGALDSGAVPVTLGDVVMDRSRGAAICSTESVFEALFEPLLASGYRVGEMLWMGETEGIWDEAEVLVPTIGAAEYERLLATIRGASGTDVTGGMRLRLETVWRLADRGATSRILDGRVAGRLAAALLSESVPGTVVVARRNAQAARDC